MSAVSPAAARGDHRRAAPGHRARERARPARRRPGPLRPALDEELDAVAAGGRSFKAVRGEYGAGKTFFARWLGRAGAAPRVRDRRGADLRDRDAAAQARDRLPAHRRAPAHRERSRRRALRAGARRVAVHARGDVLAADRRWTPTRRRWTRPSTSCWSSAWRRSRRDAPRSPPALRAYRQPPVAGDARHRRRLLAWLGGQPHVAAAVKRAAGDQGRPRPLRRLGFLQGLLAVLRDAGHPGLLLVLDEVETLQRVRADVRDKALNALRQLIDEVDAGRFPGLYLVITGTPAFFDGPRACSGCRRWPSGWPPTSPPTPASTTRGRADPAARLRPGLAGRGRRPGARPVRRGAADRDRVRARGRRRLPRRPGRRGRRPARRQGRRRARGCSSRSSSATCSTGSTSSPTSTRASDYAADRRRRPS